jgi:hypothetical protein
MRFSLRSRIGRGGCCNGRAISDDFAAPSDPGFRSWPDRAMLGHSISDKAG